jgi:hypothetical protein
MKLAMSLLVIFVGGVILSFWFHNAWVIKTSDGGKDPELPNTSETSPDGSRRLIYLEDEKSILPRSGIGSAKGIAVEKTDGSKRFSLMETPVISGGFLDNNNVCVISLMETNSFKVTYFHRRFDESFLGHFERIEVWITVLAGIAFLFSLLWMRRAAIKSFPVSV